MIELLVVLGILALLMTAIVTVGRSVITDSKARETRGIMMIVDQAIQIFHEEAPLKRVREYRDRYGDYPCDELEGFVGTGANPGIPGTSTYIGPGSNSDLNIPNNVANRDLKAMILAIRLYSPAASAVLDKIDARYRRPPDNAEEFFDRNNNASADIDDEPLTTIVDAWKTPLSYFAIKDGTLTPAPPDTNGDRLAAAAFLVKHNRGKPLLVSYGPNGRDQLSPDFYVNGKAPDLVWDLAGQDDSTAGIIDNPLNDDNVYTDESIKERLTRVDQ